MATIGNVEFNVLSESRPLINEITDHPIEDGSSVSDHIKRELRTINVTGVVGDDEDPAGKHEKLTTIGHNGRMVDYKGRTRMFNCVIESFTSDVDEKSKKGFTFSMTVREMPIAKPSTVGMLPVSLKVDIADVGSAGRVQVR